jgi:murein DD-endopeptidase MepM/ murein hydrolase activator NlpD
MPASRLRSLRAGLWPAAALLVPAGLLLATPAQSRAAPAPARATAPAPAPAVAATPPAAAAPKVMSVDEWIRVLPAPQTPDGWQAPPGPRVAWPLHGTVTQPFGCTGYELEHPTTDCPNGFHLGLDIAQPQGTPIRAAASGLAYPLSDPARYGNLVIVQHYGGYATVYGHMVRQNVSWGQRVQPGDVIGYVGTTGNSSGPHLHFEVRFAATAYDPARYLDAQPADPAPLPAGWPGAPRDDWRGIR